MEYYIGKKVSGTFDKVVERTTEALSNNGFGIITEINMKDTLKNKIDKEIPNYKILGACNPNYAYEAVMNEPQIGVMLPCSVIVREIETGLIEVASIDPVASLMAVDNEKLDGFASEVRTKLESAVAQI